MWRRVLTLGVALAVGLAVCRLEADPIPLDTAATAGASFLQVQMWVQSARSAVAGVGRATPAHAVARTQTLRDAGGRALAHVVELAPTGYIVLSPDTDIAPVIAYSLEGPFPWQEHRENALLHLVQWDMSARLRALPVTADAVKQANRTLWDLYLAAPATLPGPSDKGAVQVAAAAAPLLARFAGVEQWGPWVETYWGQRAPYNWFCPIDPTTGVRCVVGCVATAMGQVINSWRYPCSVSFASPDDDHTSWCDPGTNGMRKIVFDDDSVVRDFPAFTTWNLAYDGSAEDVAHLLLACGIPVKMGYSSDGSGTRTYYTANALKGKFGYASADAKFASTGTMSAAFYATLARNMKNEQPALLGLSEGYDAVSNRYTGGGHAIMADGYKSSGEYHLNYGWRGDSNGWYFIPADMPCYGVVDEAVVNIHPYVWPMFHHNPKHTGRTPHRGAPANNLRWRYATAGDVDSSPAVGRDGTVYVGSLDHKLRAIAPTGTWLWSYDTGDDVFSSPAIGPDGTIYVGCYDGKLYALNTNGTLRWTFTVSAAGADVLSSPTVGRDGTIYVGGENGEFYAVNPDGSRKWMIPCGSVLWSSPALASDGTVYVANGSDLTACDTNGVGILFRTLGVGDVYSSPAIANDGTIYVGFTDGKLYAINWNGTLKWTYATGAAIYSSPAIGIDGTIYVGSDDDKVYAIKPDGALKWSYVTGDDVQSSPAIGFDGADEVIYVGSKDRRVYALNPDGTEKWTVDLPAAVVSSPAIAKDGTVYVGCRDSRLYAIGGTNHAPTLAWLNQIGYIGDGVDPDWSDNGNAVFTFAVEYADRDNHFPKAGYPKLHLRKGPVPVLGSPFPMMAANAADYDCIDGKMYVRPVPAAGLADGDDYTYRFETQDAEGAAGDGDPNRWAWGPLLDTTPPDTQITVGPGQFVQGGANNAIFCWSGSDAISAAANLFFSYRLDPNDWSVWSKTKMLVATRAEGTYTFQVKARDELGHEDATPDSRTFMVDATLPSNPLNCTETGGTRPDTWQKLVGDPAFTWGGASDGVNGSGIAGYYWYFGPDANGNPVEWTANAGCDPAAVAGGTYSLRVKTEDRAGNQTVPVTLFVFKYDGTPPAAPVIASAVGHDWQANNSPTFTWTCSDAGGSGLSRYSYQLDGSPWTSTVNPPKSYNRLAEGTHAFRVKAEDVAGNVGPEATYDFKIDLAPPVAVLRVNHVGEIRKNEVVEFDGSASSDGNGIARHEWNFGDGSPPYAEENGNVPDGVLDGKTTHAFATAGVFQVTLTVTDLAGSTGKDTAVVTVTSKPTAAINSVQPSPAVAGQRVSFSGTGVDPDRDDIVAYEWISNVDGLLSVSNRFNTQALTASNTAPHTISFRVKDSDGFWSDEVTWVLWVYLPKAWPMFKHDAARLSAQSIYPDVPHGQYDYVVAWSALTDGGISGSPVAANVDEDWVNGLEIAVATTAGTLYLLDNLGNPLWSKPIGTSYSTPAIGDINGDGHLEIVVGSTNGLYAFDRNGSNLFTYVAAAAQPSSKEFASSPVITDMVGVFLPPKGIVMGYADGTVRAVSADGDQLWTNAAGVGVKFVSSPAVADLDPDYDGPEIAIGGTDGKLYVFRADGQLITSWSAGGASIDTTPAIADLVPATNGLEIVFGAENGRCYCLNYNPTTHALTKVWQYPAVGSPPLTEAIDSSPAIELISGYNGETADVVFGCDDGTVYVLLADADAWGNPGGTCVGTYACAGAPQVNSTAAIGDLDTRLLDVHGNNRADVAFGHTLGKLHGVNFSAGAQDLTPPAPCWSPVALSVGPPVKAIDSSPALADVDHDGNLEIIVGSADGQLYLLDCRAPAASHRPVCTLASGYLGLVGHDLTLDASDSYDPDESLGDYVDRYEWDFGYGYTSWVARTPATVVPWSALQAMGVTNPGTYALTCTLYDSTGLSSYPASSTLRLLSSAAVPVAVPGGPYALLIGQPLTLSATNSYADGSENAVAAYAWDLDGDGLYDDETRPQATFCWQDLAAFGITTAGTYAAGLKVTDSLGQESAPTSTTVQVTSNGAPVVAAGGPYDIEIGQSVTLVASGGDPDEPSDTIVACAWDVNGDGQFGEFTGTNVTVPWSFLSTGCVHRGQSAANPVRVRACDTRGGLGTSTNASLFICTNEPVAVAEADGSTAPIIVWTGADVTFSHGASFHGWPSHHTNVLYAWDFDGNGGTDWSTTSAAASNLWSYATTGVFCATLIVTDDNTPAKSATDVVEVTVGNLPPVADPSGPYPVAFSDGVVLHGEASHDLDGSVVLYAWDLDHDGAYDDGDGAQLALSWTNLATFGTTNAGTAYPICLRVVDNEGAANVATTVVTVVRETLAVEGLALETVYSDAASVSLSVTDDDGEPLRHQQARPKTLWLEALTGTTWMVLADDVLSSAGDTNQQVNFTFTIRQGAADLAPGTNTIRIRFDGDPEYDAYTREGTLTLAREEVAIAEPLAQVVCGSNTVVHVMVRDDDGEFLYHQAPSGHTMALEVYDGASWALIGEDALSSPANGDDLLEYTVAVGPAALDLPHGVYSLRVRFDGDTYYAPTATVGSLTVGPAAVRFQDDVDLPTGDWTWQSVYTASNTIGCRLVDGVGSNLCGQAAEPKTVYLEIRQGAEWSVLATNSLNASDDASNTLGFACQIIEGLQDVAPGTNDVRFRFDGDSRYAAATQEATLVVARQVAQFVDPDGDWNWSFAAGQAGVLHVRLVDPAWGYLRHLADEPKVVTVEYRQGVQWIELGATVITEPLQGAYGSTYEDAWIRFPPIGGLGTVEIRFRFDGDTYYAPAQHGGTLTLEGPPQPPRGTIITQY